MTYTQGYEDGVRATKAEYLKLLEEESHPVKELTEEKSYEVVFDGEKYTTKLVEPKVKELTDEEILIVWTLSNFVRYTETGHIDEIFFNKFAKAILLKAQEK